MTPSYDITFSPSADGYKRRRKKDQYDYFRMLPGDTKIDVVFFGGKDYLPLFCSLTEAISCKKIVFFNSASVPRVNSCTLTPGLLHLQRIACGFGDHFGCSCSDGAKPTKLILGQAHVMTAYH